MHTHLLLLALISTLIFALPVPTRSDIALSSDISILQRDVPEELCDGRALIARDGEGQGGGKPNLFNKLVSKFPSRIFGSSSKPPVASHEELGERVKHAHAKAEEMHKDSLARVEKATATHATAKTNKEADTNPQTKQAFRDATADLEREKRAQRKALRVLHAATKDRDKWVAKDAKLKMDTAVYEHREARAKGERLDIAWEFAGTQKERDKIKEQAEAQLGVIEEKKRARREAERNVSHKNHYVWSWTSHVSSHSDNGASESFEVTRLNHPKSSGDDVDFGRSTAAPIIPHDRPLSGWQQSSPVRSGPGRSRMFGGSRSWPRMVRSWTVPRL
ncbi:hypothetical protein DACRYDRAFT_112154 [Dacryopinax primogenitus]|uniref:Uncharacterized protein n=1 Tax=Dacryopinax primogenitus (strain DJM 731) TaxID=1858805 RepID=M5G097_DACPD|nr:uncharacterized protein DACRYDRAFT_112154 [Dacryopinax primogenitus]EJT97202.1 hypothetical protein DACRYDRAFT_112154 [Dacryopinax primogenitus]